MSNDPNKLLIESILAMVRAIDGDMDRFDEAAASRLGLSRTDFRCLDVLSRGRSMTPGQLAQQTGLSTGATTAQLDRLERGGFIKRERDPHDRRRVFVQPTRRSIDGVWPVFEGLVAGATQMMEKLRTEELETILRFLQNQQAIVRQHLPGAAQHRDQNSERLAGNPRVGHKRRIGN